MKATLQTLADELGVSRSTVSNAYSRPDQLSPDLRARILSAAQRLGYSGPNPTARSLRSGKVNAIGVLLTDNLSMAFTDPYAVAYLRGLAEAASARETSLLLLSLPKDEAAGRRIISNAAVDAFCLYCVPDWHSALELVRSRGVPVVIGEDPQAFGPEASYVGIDERAAARRLGEHIVNLGHRDIAVVAHWIVEDGVTEQGTRQVHADPDDLRYYVTGERVRGFRDALLAAGVPWERVVLINAAGNQREEGTEAAAHALDRLDRATAVLCTSDVLALGVLDALRARGLQAGRDVSVTGFDDIPEAEAAGLTTIRQPSVERGRLAGELLLDPPEDPALRRLTLPVSLVVRSTTGPNTAKEKS